VAAGRGGTGCQAQQIAEVAADEWQLPDLVLGEIEILLGAHCVHERRLAGDGDGFTRGSERERKIAPKLLTCNQPDIRFTLSLEALHPIEMS
jgi:hypothetical protein